MPATRKSTRGAAARAAASKGQSTLSFNHKVTKTGAAKSSKDKLSTPTTTTTTKKAKKEPEPQTPLSEDAVEAQVETQQPEEANTVQPEHEKSDAELRAEKVTDAQIKRYWKGVEAARISRRVHQEDLSQAEKVLRYFDVSSQYGPCIGIPRARRWHRAERLGLNPPIEVLAVLLKGQGRGDEEIERPAMERLMESTAIGSG